MVTKVVGGKEYEVIQKDMLIRDLKFYLENPRVYSMFDRSEKEPTQEEMEEAMCCAMDDVKELKGTIEKNGAILTPLIVRDGDYVVLEGNRRLAASKMLAKKDSKKWSTVPCEVYPADIDDDAVFCILGICHLNGQKKWAPFEEASLIYRRIKATGKSYKEIADSVGHSKSEIQHCYEIYSMMMEYNDLNSEHWSYYEEYYKNKNLKKIRKQIPELDKSVSDMIKSGKVTDAKSDIREKMGQIAKLPETKSIETFKEIISEKKTLDEAAGELENLNVDIYRAINLFRTKIMDPNTKKSIDALSREDAEKYIVNLNMIQNTIKQILEKLENRDE